MSIYEYKNVLSNILCEDIIDKFETYQKMYFEIPKNDNEWNKIERVLYKQLLINIKNYKLHIIEHLSNNENIHILPKLNNLYTKSLLIEKHNNYLIEKNALCNRYNILIYIFFLNTVASNGKIQPEIGKLVICDFDTYNKYILNISDNKILYKISGTICYNNIV
jgi:hypothetical protein